MSAIEKNAAMLRREAESMKGCHTVGVGGEWYGESAKTEYDEMIAVAAAASAERDELRAKIAKMEKQEPAYWGPKHAIEGSSTTVIVSKFPVNPTDAPLYALPGAKGEEK